MSLICRPCTPPLVLICPDDFGAGSAVVPVPTRQRVCNTEQTASCPDGSQPQVVPAGTFCTTVLNPTASSVAEAQAQMDAMALAQAQSQVGDCCWDGIVWTAGSINIDPLPNGPGGVLLSSAASAGDFSVGASSGPNCSPTGALGVRVTGILNFTCGLNQTLCHNISGRFTNVQTGAGSGVFQSSVTISTFGAAPPGCDVHAGETIIFNESHAGLLGLGTFDFSHDFTTHYTGTPLFFRICVDTTVYAQAGLITHNQLLVGKVKTIDCP